MSGTAEPNSFERRRAEISPTGDSAGSQPPASWADAADFRSLFDATPVLIWLSGPTKEGVYFNKPWVDFTGEPLEHQLGDGWLRSVHPEDRPELARQCAAAFQERQQFTSQFRLRRRDGEYRWMSDSGTPFFSPGGEFLGFIGTCVDVTEKRLIEETTRSREELLRTVFDASSIGIVLADPDTGRYLQINTKFCELTGYSEEELLRLTFSDLTHPEDRGKDWEQYRQAVEGGSREYTVEKRYVRGDGQTIWIRVACSFVRDSHGTRLYDVAIIQDITQSRQAEDALRESEQRFHDLADNIAQLAWMTDKTGWIFWYNKRWFEYTGSTLKQMEGWGWSAVQHPDYVQRVTKKFREHIEHGQVWEDTFPLRGRDGLYRWFLSRAIPIRDEQGQIIRWFGTNTDISERMQFEEELREASRRKDEFLALLGHELRNPLAAIVNGAEVLKSAPFVDEATEKVRDIIARQADQMRHLIDDLLDISRITSGKIVLRTEKLDLRFLLRSVVADHQATFASAGIHLDMEFGRTPVIVEGDAARISQMLGNLLHNASKFTSSGGHVSLTLRSDETDRFARMIVQDSGIGMSPETLRTVFEPFTQVKSGHSGGLGLGLSLVKGLAEMHGGSVAARSIGLGEGSEFSISLPRCVGTPVNQSVLPKARAGEIGTAYRILVVEDTEAVRHVFSLVLRDMGHEVEVADNGIRACELLSVFRPEIVFSDIAMPGMDGYALARHIRELAVWRDIVLIALTGFGQNTDRTKAFEAGFDYHLTKPVDQRELRQILATVSAQKV